MGSFIYETDTTVNKNELRIQFSILIEILNTGKTFPFDFSFINSETTESFEFIEQKLDDLIFYNCPRSKVICGAFSNSLASAIAKQEIKHQAYDKPQIYTLQLCKSHKVKAIKRRLVAAERYFEDV